MIKIVTRVPINFFFALFLITGLSQIFVSASESLAGKGKLNILLIIADDLNAHVGPSGYSAIKTPALDKFANGALTFRRAYVQYPVCGSSRASFLSGMYPETTGIFDNSTKLHETRPGMITMAEFFRQRGYWTGVANKIYHRPDFIPEGATDANHLFENDHLPVLDAMANEFERRFGKPAEGKEFIDYSLKHATQVHDLESVGYGPSGLEDQQHRDGKGADLVMKWIEERPDDKPFFIAWGLAKPHVPFLAPDKYFAMYPQAELPELVEPADHYDFIPAIANQVRYIGFGFTGLKNQDDAQRRRYMQAYHACISFVDAQIGRVLDLVKSQGLWDNTIVIFSSDHGYHLGEHGLWAKFTLFEECARVPMVVHVPGLTPKGETSQGLVELVDLFPTLTELSGFEDPANFQGESLVKLLKDPSGPGKEAAYTVMKRGQKLGRAIRTQRWHYADWDGSGEQLYDLEKDPKEYRNLVDDFQHRETLNDMRALLQKIRNKASGNTS
ncbi:MAG: sulfatase [Verrucomicrobia bacterium]|nr:sulfatase [Verrucomicrobiota bacterium]